MTDSALLLLLIVAPGPLFIGAITLPRWFFRSLHRHRLWELRDAIVDDILADRLPKNHPAVKQLARRAESAARNCKQVSIFDLRVYRYIVDREPGLEPQIRAMVRTRDLGGLTADQKELIVNYRDSMLMLLSGTMLLGSWFGLGAVAWVLVGDVAHRVKESFQTRRAPADASVLHEAWQQAIETAAASTSLGRRVTEIARAKSALSVLDG